MIANLSPEDAQKLAALDQYAAETRETVYRGFETLDEQRRVLNVARIHYQTEPKDGRQILSNIEIRSLNSAIRFVEHSQRKAEVLTQSLSLDEERGERERIGDHQRGRRESNLTLGVVDSEREWHFDNLHDVLHRITWNWSSIKRICGISRS